MADTTTVKVQTSTRDLLLQVGASRRQSADQVILAALAAMQRDERRQSSQDDLVGALTPGGPYLEE